MTLREKSCHSDFDSYKIFACNFFWMVNWKVMVVSGPCQNRKRRWVTALYLFHLRSGSSRKCIESSFLRRNVHRMIKMSLGMKNELPKRILIIHVARVSHQVFARVGSRVLSGLEFQDWNSHKCKVLTLIKKRYLKERIWTWQLSKHITNICFESVVVK